MPKKKLKPPIKNMGASVRSRLLNLSKQRRQPFQMVLTYYVLERLLYRLSQTKHRDRFILKGAMLLTKWFEDPLRPTQDLDFLGIGSDDQNEKLAAKAADKLMTERDVNSYSRTLIPVRDTEKKTS